MKKIKKMGTGGLPAGSPERGGGFSRGMRPMTQPPPPVNEARPQRGGGLGVTPGLNVPGGRSSSLGEPGMPSIIGGRPMPVGGGQKPLVQQPAGGGFDRPQVSQPAGRPLPRALSGERPMASLGRGGARPMQVQQPVGGGIATNVRGPSQLPAGMTIPVSNKMKKGGSVKSKSAPAKTMASGGKVSSASKRADGCAIRGKTKA